MEIAIYVFAAIGVILVARYVLIPLIWCCLYATGKVIFQVRAASPAWRTGRPWHKVVQIAYAWLRAFEEAITFPASRIEKGGMSWTPLFQYRGFNRTPAQKDSK